ncbi:MAG: insulinase family protein [Bdellovibrionaceae bacterium]|nr:insulinase family protein [Pseudobdellovibrionaceae bacterium]
MSCDFKSVLAVALTAGVLLSSAPAAAQSKSVLTKGTAPTAKSASANAANPGDIGAQIRFPVEKYALPNGLVVLLAEDHSAPLISYQTWFRVGSKDEEPGYTGIAHLFEHMMFKGAKRYTGEQFDTILQANGATNNAFTSYDYTGYYENLPSSKLELVIDIESDRMENLNVTEDNLRSEREVVKEERRYRVDNNPHGMLSEVLYGTAFRVHPYRWPVIGYMADLNNINLAKSIEFYRQFYAPNNAVIVVAGDFDTKEAKKLIEKYYGKIPAQEIKRRPRPSEPPVASARSQFVAKDVQNVTFAISYHTPKAGEEEAYALDLLANIMGRGTSSRLYKRLVYKDQMAGSVSAYNSTKQDSGLLTLTVSLKPGANFSQAQRAVYGEMWQPRHWLVKDQELEMAKNQTMKDYVDSLKTVHGKAEMLALNEILFGDYARVFTDLEHYNRVTPEQIRKAAVKYLSPEKSILAVLRPQAGKKNP